MFKKWFTSKTLWANVFLGTLIAAQALTEYFVIDPEIQGVALSVINLFLRLKTTTGLSK